MNIEALLVCRERERESKRAKRVKNALFLPGNFAKKQIIGRMSGVGRFKGRRGRGANTP